MSVSVGRGGSAPARVLLLVLYLATFVLLNKFASPLPIAPGVLPWNPGAGLNLALLFGLGPSLAPAILLATLTTLSSNLWNQSSPFAWAVTALILTVGYSLAAVLLRRFLHAAAQLTRTRDVLALVGVALLAPAVIGFLVVLDLGLFGLTPEEGFLTAWYRFWVGDAVGILAFAPFLLLYVVAPIDALFKGESWRQAIAAPLAKWVHTCLSPREIAQTLVEATSIAAVLWLGFWTSLGQQFDVLFLCFLPLHWIALRRGLRGATTGILVVDVGVTLAAQANGSAPTSATELKLFMLVLSVSTLYLGAIVRERRDTEEALRKSEGLYRLLEERVLQRTSEIERLLEAERHRAEQLRVIQDLGQRITSMHSVDEILSMAAQMIREAFGYYHVHIGLVEGDMVTFKPRAGVWRENPGCDWCAPLRLKVGVEGLCGWVAGTGEPLLIPDVSQEPRFVSVEGIRTGAALVLPLKYEDQIIGTLDMETERPGGFDESDVPVLQALVNQIAVAIENARLYEQAQQRMRELQALYDADEALYGSLKVEHVLNTLVDKATELLGADKSTVMVWDKARERLIVGAARGFSLEVLPQMVHSPGEGVTTLVATTGIPIVVEDAASDSRVARRITDAEGIRSLMHVPITIGGEIFGVFGVNYCERHSFTEEEKRILTALAQRAAIAIQNARLFDQAQQAVLLEERQRLARELHDSVSQALYGIALGARTARAQLARDPARAAEPLDYVLSLADAGLAEMRALIFELRPESLETEGLVAALAKQAAAVRARHGLRVQTAFGDEPQVPTEIKQALYRIAQEALQNTIKHARATSVQVELASGVEGISLHLSDDGIGFDPTQSFPGHVGLHSMQERAARLGGKLEVTSEPHRGTRVSVQIPVVREPVR